MSTPGQGLVALQSGDDSDKLEKFVAVGDGWEGAGRRCRANAVWNANGRREACEKQELESL